MRVGQYRVDRCRFTGLAWSASGINPLESSFFDNVIEWVVAHAQHPLGWNPAQPTFPAQGQVAEIKLPAPSGRMLAVERIVRRERDGDVRQRNHVRWPFHVEFLYRGIRRGIGRLVPCDDSERLFTCIADKCDAER